MACFLVPTAEAVVMTAVGRSMAARRKAIEEPGAPRAHGASEPEGTARRRPAAEFGEQLLVRLNWLTTMLWGGTALLAFEHLWHGEITVRFPFLTAAASPAETEVMLREMATVGVGMAAAVTIAWMGLVLAASAVQRRPRQVGAARSAAA